VSALVAETIDLYLASMNALPLPLRELGDMLPAPERARIARFQREADQQRQTAAAALLRWVLATYRCCDPASLEFTRGAYGKPGLQGGPAFNLSHSGAWILIGVAPSGRLGVDVEVVRPLADMDRLAHQNFAPDEVSALLETQPSQRERTFYRAWTRKEAYLKALGHGLTLPLHSFSVSLDPAPDAALLRTDDPSEPPEGWSLRSVPCPPDAEAALAWDRPACSVRWRALPGTTPGGGVSVQQPWSHVPRHPYGVGAADVAFAQRQVDAIA